MTPHQIREQQNRIKGRIAYHRDYLTKQARALPSVLETYGLGAAFGEIIAEMSKQNEQLIAAELELRDFNLELDFSGSGAQPAHA